MVEDTDPKEGQLRNNMMGKRCNQTGRTVIGADPTLKLGQLGVPIDMANILTVPERVASYNYDKLTDIVNSGKANYVLLAGDEKRRINLDHRLHRRGTRLLGGDVIHRKGKQIPVETGREILEEGDKIMRNKEFVKDIKYPELRTYKLNIGDIVERKLKNGDYVLLNRQPTLHKASMQAMEVVLHSDKTLKMNLAITSPFNADFDGDEMNVHIPQSLEAQAELRELSAAKYNLISAQSSKPNMKIVQDSLLGAYRMTLGDQKLTKAQFFDIGMKTGMTGDQILSKMQHIRKVLQKLGRKVQCFNGKGIISLFLPEDLIYEKKNGANPDEPVVKIYRGVLYEGAFDKNIIGSAHNSLIQIINKEYGPDETSTFIDNIQFVTNSWLMYDGFSIGLGDCLVSEDLNENGISKEQEIRDVVNKSFIEAEGIKSTTIHPGIREMRVNAALNKAKDIGLRIAKEALAKDNNFISTVASGSKGDWVNLAQIAGLLGQQNLQGKRVPLFLNHGRRTLPHYPFEGMTPEQEYESRGFISSSFIKGLNPREFYFHAMSGREGISDTAMGTATSGYMQRRIIKLTEDVKVTYDGTVRDVTGRLYQFAYGGDGVDPTTTVKVDDRQEMCDISRLADKLNMEYEIGMEKKGRKNK